MHVSSYTLGGWLKGDMQLHTKEGFSPEISCKMREVVLPLHYHWTMLT